MTAQRYRFPERRGSRIVVWGRTVVTVLAVFGVYVALPLQIHDVSGAVLAFRGVVLLASFPVLTWLIARQVRRALSAGHQLREQIAVLFTLVSVVVAFFASLCYLLSEQFQGIETKVDALYFAVATLCTVGYGDVTPVGQVARAAVIVQMLFNLVIVTSAVSIIVSAVTGRIGQPATVESERVEGPPRAEEPPRA